MKNLILKISAFYIVLFACVMVVLACMTDGLLQGIFAIALIYVTVKHNRTFNWIRYSGLSLLRLKFPNNEFVNIFTKKLFVEE